MTDPLGPPPAFDPCQLPLALLPDYLAGALADADVGRLFWVAAVRQFRADPRVKPPDVFERLRRAFDDGIQAAYSRHVRDNGLFEKVRSMIRFRVTPLIPRHPPWAELMDVGFDVNSNAGSPLTETEVIDAVREAVYWALPRPTRGMRHG